MPRHSGASSASRTLRPQYAAIVRDDERMARRRRRARKIADRPLRSNPSTRKI